MNKGEARYTEGEAFERVAMLCAASEHCASQITEKLTGWGLGADQSSRIIERLMQEGYIDESRFARAYALDKFNYNGWGRVKIDLMLRRLGLTPADRETARRAVPDADYRRALLSLLRAKARGVKAQSAYELRGKLFRFATGRGFEGDIIASCLDEALGQGD